MSRIVESTLIITTGGALWFGDADSSRPGNADDAREVARRFLRLPNGGGSLDAMISADGWIWIDFSGANGRIGARRATDSNERLAIWHDRLQVLHTILYFILAGTTDANRGQPTPWAFTRTPLATVTGSRVGCPSSELAIGIGSLDSTGQVPIRALPEVAQRALDATAVLLEHRVDASALVELLLKSLVAYQAHDHGHCAVLAWAICEAALNAQFRDALDGMVMSRVLAEGQASQFRKQRMKSAEIANLLLVAGVLGGTLYDQMSTARKARNAWVHQLRMPGVDIPTTCMFAARSAGRVRSSGVAAGR